MVDDREHDDLDGTRMPLREHLEELRRCLFRSVAAFIVLLLGALALGDRLIRFYVVPYTWARESILAAQGKDIGPLQIIRPAEGILFHMKVAGATALLLGAPWFLWQLWTFVAAGLHLHEKRAVLRAFPAGLVLFVAGLAFGFFVLVPFALPFLLTWVPEDVSRPSVTMAEYFAFLVSLTLLMGLVFELPILMWVVVRSGLMAYGTLAGSRRVAYVVMLVFAAVMTPPDVVTQVLVAIPMIGLYEAGLLLARRAEARRQAQEAARL